MIAAVSRHVWPLIAAGALGCGGPQDLGRAGAKCFRDDDCVAGLVCVAPAGKTARVCSSDLTPIISMVDGPPVAQGGGEATANGGTGGGAASGGSEIGGSEAGGTPSGGTGGGSSGSATTAGSGGSSDSAGNAGSDPGVAGSGGGSGGSSSDADGGAQP